MNLGLMRLSGEPGSLDGASGHAQGQFFTAQRWVLLDADTTCREW